MAKVDRSDPFTVRVASLEEVAQQFTLHLEKAALGDLLGREERVYRPGEAGVSGELMISRTGENIFVKGRVQTSLEFSCVRCLSENSRAVEVPIEWSVLPEATYREAAAAEEIELSAEDLDVSFYSGDVIDLRDIVREAIVLELEPHPTCEADCELETLAADASEGSNVDPRWLPLLELKRKKKKLS